MDIGKTIRTITIEPAVVPVPQPKRQPARPAPSPKRPPAPAPKTPVKTPEKV